MTQYQFWLTVMAGIPTLLVAVGVFIVSIRNGNKTASKIDAVAVNVDGRMTDAMTKLQSQEDLIKALVAEKATEPVDNNPLAAVVRDALVLPVPVGVPVDPMVRTAKDALNPEPSPRVPSKKKAPK